MFDVFLLKMRPHSRSGVHAGAAGAGSVDAGSGGDDLDEPSDGEVMHRSIQEAITQPAAASLQAPAAAAAAGEGRSAASASSAGGRWGRMSSSFEFQCSLNGELPPTITIN